MLVDFNLAVAQADCQTAKLLISHQISDYALCDYGT